MRVGIILTGSYGWTGGLYYSLNIIKLLQEISLTRKLKIVVITNRSTPKELIKEIQLKNVEVIDLDNKTLFHKVYCKLIGFLMRINYRFINDVNALRLDVIFPVIKFDPSHRKLNCKVYYWLYDFQHKFLDHLFTENEIKQRDLDFSNISQNAEHIILSSFDAQKHFMEFYPNSKAKIDVYRFISLLNSSTGETPKKNNVPEDYLIVCNQFWQHKNHMVVLKALTLLVKEKKPVHIVFTGKADNPENKSYVDELYKYISEHGLSSFLTLTGFISREDQISLMKKARAVIQPSFFEGWSTVIEDAKALNKFLIASDISINKEQVKENVRFFGPNDPIALSEHIKSVSNDQFELVSMDYNRNIEESKKDLIEIFNL